MKKPSLYLAALSGALADFKNIPGAVIGALEYQQFAWSARRRVVLNSYCDVAVCVNGGAMGTVRYDAALEVKEDRDIVLQVLASGFRSVRHNGYAFAAPKNGSNDGGLKNVYAEDGCERAASEAMVKKWGPGICSLHIKKDGRPDVKINWRAFK